MRRPETRVVTAPDGYRVFVPSLSRSSGAKEDAEGLFTAPSTPSEGIFYVIYMPAGWSLFSCRLDEYGDNDHSQFWVDYVAPELSRAWAAPLKKTPSFLETALADHVYGFPRGRISKGSSGRSRGHLVLHGGDFTELGISTAAVERAFSLQGVAKWECDEHERCQKEDQTALCQILKMGKPTWPAANMEDEFD